jgi:5'(3')-deoxyribonucleotidase
MSKQKIFWDFDNTLCNSHQKIAEIYNQTFTNHKEFIPAKWWECTDYEMTSICPLMNHELKMSMFNCSDFFKNLPLINGNTYDILKELNERYEQYIITIGNPSNLAHKSLYLETTLPFIKNVILIRNEGCKMDKSIINMGKNSIFFDDIISNLDSSDATYKFVFGEEENWNKTDKYTRVVNFTDVERILL